MESDSPEKIGWTYVKNSVESRMLDDSMVHRLTSMRKMQRRTKLFNAMLKKLAPTTRYSQYTKIKRMVLTNVPDDYETEDDEVVLTVDDYNSLYNSGKLQNYTTTDFDDSVNLYCKEIRKSTHRNKTKTVDVSVDAKRRTSQRIINKRSQSKESLSRNLEEEESCNDVVDVLQSAVGNDVSPLAEFCKDASISRIKENEELEKKSTESNDAPLNNESQREESAEKQSEDAIQQPSTEGEGASDRNIEAKEETSVKKTPRLSINNADGKMSIEGQYLCNKARRNLISELENINDTDNIRKEDDTNNEQDPETDSIAECNPIGQSTPLYQDTMYQLKDSGIDEDSQEEFSGDPKYSIESMKINQKNKTNVYLKTSTPLATEEGVDDNGKMDACDETESNINLNDTVVVKEDNKTIAGENREEKSHKQDLPQVTSTEVVSKKYKIVREGRFQEMNNTITKKCSTLPINTTTISNANEVESDVNNDDKKMDKSQIDKDIYSDTDISSHNDGYKPCYNDYDYGEDADDEENNPISPATTKRLQQLKRLNLTKEESSSSDDDTEFYFAKIPDGILNTIHDTTYKKNSEKHKINRNDCNKENRCRNTQEMIPDKNKELDETNLEENQEISTEETSGRRLIVRKRPENLQEFIQEEKLIENRTATTFILNDVDDDDDIYMLNIPSTMLSSDLAGKKLVLKETKARFGKDRYRISHRGENSISCVMSTGKQHKPYKTVKIKLTGVITVREKLPRLVASIKCNDSACDSTSFGRNVTKKIPKQSQTKKRVIDEIGKGSEGPPRKKRIRSS